jgi:thiamine-phosphate pyrophosphorylase
VTKPDVRLYGLVDPENAGGHDLLRLADAMAAGGVTLIQLRDKKSETGDLVRLAKELKAILDPRHVKLLVNDRVDVAFAAGAAGVHLGQNDLDPASARRMLGGDAIIGLSIRNQAEADAAPLDLINYVGLGGVFATTSKVNKARPIGLEGLHSLSKLLRARRPGLPICAIAGITIESTTNVIEAGADGVAVISALSSVADPAAVARDFRAEIDAALAIRGAA